MNPEKVACMKSSVKSLPRCGRRDGGPVVKDEEGDFLDLDGAVDRLEAVAMALDRMKWSESDPLRGVIAEMCNVVRRASKDAGRILRDARGF